MIKKNKNILIFLSVGIVLIISMFFVFNKSYEYHELPKVKVKDTLKNKQFALMLEQDNGEYKESEKELPTRGYTFNLEKSGCTDINGKIIDDVLDYNYENNMVTLNTSKTSYCYLYYDIEPNVSYLVSKDENNYISKELTGGLYRYQGLGIDAINNYICYGTSEKEECINNPETYMYRIIGVTSTGELKLIKNTWIEENGTNVFQWHSLDNINTCPNGKCPEWNESDLFYRLNGKDINKTGLSNIFIDNPNYPYLSSTEEINAWYNNILYHDWLYGDTYNINYIGNDMYAIETGQSVAMHYDCKSDCANIDNWYQEEYKWNISVNAKIGLMYAHDYIYAYKTNDLDAGKPNNAVNAKLSWMYLEKEGTSFWRKAEWTMTRRGIDIFETYQGGFSAWFIYETGSISFSWNWYGNFDEQHYVRPVFYVSPNLNISGNGTATEPFTINFN